MNTWIWLIIKSNLVKGKLAASAGIGDVSSAWPLNPELLSRVLHERPSQVPEEGRQPLRSQPEDDGRGPGCHRDQADAGRTTSAFI